MSQILIIPNTILRNKSNPIKEVSDNEIILSKKMRKIMNDAPGVGLAAPQLGILKRIITINVKESSDEKNLSYTLFNPEIISYSKKKVILEEGDAIFLPRGWWHYVESLEPSINVSIHYWRLNGIFKDLITGLIKMFLHNIGLYKKHDCACHIFNEKGERLLRA